MIDAVLDSAYVEASAEGITSAAAINTLATTFLIFFVRPVSADLLTFGKNIIVSY